MKKKIITAIFLLLNIITYAQKQEITLKGVVKCKEENKDALPFVHVYNKNTKLGDVTDTEGRFSIKMGATDTILFSSIQHLEQVYYIKDGDFFHDKSIEIDMQQDTVWLNVVAVMGFDNFEEFKKEVIATELPQENISYAMPAVDKYAKQHATGEGAIELKEPLTYLLEKMNLLKSRSKHQLNQE